MTSTGGQFEFDDGGSYSGDWRDGKADGYGVCTGPKGCGKYAGSWDSGFEISGVYTWPSGNTYAGQWQDGKRNGVGVETKGHWLYRGEWSHGLKGRYGVRSSTVSGAKYEGTWMSGLQDGYGIETYVDESTYQGQWQKGVRHGYGVRKSVPYAVAAPYRNSSSFPNQLQTTNSLPTGLAGKTSSGSDAHDTATANNKNDKPDKPDRSRGGFVLVERSASASSPVTGEIRGRSSSFGRSLADKFKLKKQQSTSDIPKVIRNSTISDSKAFHLSGSADTGKNCLVACSVDVVSAGVTETYAGEWKCDKRSGFGVSERSDGLKYVGEWFNDKKCGYGVTILRDGSKEEGKYKNNDLVSSSQKRKLFRMNREKSQEKVEASVAAAKRAAEVATQKSEIALNRRTNAKLKCEQADNAAKQAEIDAEIAENRAVQVTLERKVEGDQGAGETNQVQPQSTSFYTPMPEKKQVTLTPNKLPPREREESGDSYISNFSNWSSSKTSLSPTLTKTSDQSQHQPESPQEQCQNNGGPTRLIDPSYNSDFQTARLRNSTPTAAAAISPTPENREVATLTKSVLRKDMFEHRKSLDFSDSSFESGKIATRMRERSQPSVYLYGKEVSADDGSEFHPRRRNGPLTPRRDYIDSPLELDDSQLTGQQANSFRFPPPVVVVAQDLRNNSATAPQMLSSMPTNSQISSYREDPFRSDSKQVLTKRASVKTSPPSGPIYNSDSNRQREQYYNNSSQINNTLNKQSRNEDVPSYQQRFPARQEQIPVKSSSSFRQTRHVQLPRNLDPTRKQDVQQIPGPSNSSQPLQRRRTLPTIIRNPVKDWLLPGSRLNGDGQGSTIQPGGSRETFLIENGVRKRLVRDATPTVNSASAVGTQTSAYGDDQRQAVALPRYRTDPAKDDRSDVGASLPDVRHAPKVAAMPREEISALSQARREEIRRLRENEDGQIIIRLSDIKAWCRQNQLIILLIALNVSLSALFFSFLTTKHKDSTE